MKLTDPQKNYNSIRDAVLKTFEMTKDFDISKNIIKGSQLTRGEKNGLEGELVFWERFFGKVTPTSNFGEKADFMSTNRKEFFDVTTDLIWKNPEDYIELESSKGAKYKIALVDVKTKQIDVIPITVPKCIECDGKSFYIVHLLHQGYDAYQPLSKSQIISVYCPSCENVERESDYNFIMHSPLLLSQELTDIMEPSIEERKGVLLHKTMDIIRFLSITSRKILFGLGEKAFLMTDQHGEGTYGTYLYWKKPCARNLMENFLDFHIIDDAESIVITPDKI